ncbi:efflux RND transporter periplasmic adaptor subunit [Rariglobus hedericola]|uniref:Efflux RND transporter periplasmic adaptor subunit n=1 Tax=Rariglobus hedericola TaxID=2597822 RepID=A0A556QIV4_9BACT|nr:efflux RND transporter periplasmic adaptor subunit [Rariglobus hedericola]TSJ76559.1 efflux RND transporter periplasmic adaptor subunit [Rariglobus hedericola]
MSSLFRPLLAATVSLAGLLPAVEAAVPRIFDGLILPYREVVVSTPVQGQIESISVKEGDAVTAGQTLGQLNNRLESLEMDRAKIVMSKKNFDFKGSKNLFDEKIISEDEVLNRRSEAEVAKLQYDVAAELVAQRTIKAPSAGLIVEKNREIGETVTATQPLFRIVDITQVYAQIFIRAEDLALVKEGNAISVRVPVLGPDATFKGTVDFIDPRVDAASGLLRVKVLIPNPEARLKAGLRAEVSL